ARARIAPRTITFVAVQPHGWVRTLRDTDTFKRSSGGGASKRTINRGATRFIGAWADRRFCKPARPCAGGRTSQYESAQRLQQNKGKKLRPGKQLQNCQRRREDRCVAERRPCGAVELEWRSARVTP